MNEINFFASKKKKNKNNAIQNYDTKDTKHKGKRRKHKTEKNCTHLRPP